MPQQDFDEEPTVASPAGGKLIAVVGTPTDGDIPEWDATNNRWVPAAPGGAGSIDLDDLADVSVASPTDGYVLTFDSGSGLWIASAPSGGSGVEPPPYSRRESYHQATPNLLSYQSLNLPFAFSGVGSSSVDNLSGFFCVRNATSATIGSVAGVEASSMGWFARDLKPIYVARQATYTSVADVRFWFGLASATPSGSADPSGVHLAAFRYDTATDGTAFWRCCTKDGTTMTVTATSVAVATDTVYLFRIETDSSAVRFYIDGNLVATHTTNLPGSSTAIGPTAKVTALAAAAKSLRHSRLYLSWLG
jgi:hypothetical protein